MSGFKIEGNRVRGLALGGHNELHFCRHGPMLYNKHDKYVGRSLRVYGEYNRQEALLLGALITPDSVVVEVGANIGTHTVPMAKRARQVWAFEPQRLVFQTLCANLALNQLTNVIALPFAVSDRYGETRILDLDPTVPNNFGAATCQDGVGAMVSVVRLHEGLFGSMPGHIDLLKIDVEGMELEVLRGAHTLISNARPFLYVECDRPDKAEALVEYMRAQDYDLYWHLPPLFDPDNFEQQSADVFPGICSQNVLGVPAGRAFNTDLRPVVDFDDVVLQPARQD